MITNNIIKQIIFTFRACCGLFLFIVLIFSLTFVSTKLSINCVGEQIARDLHMRRFYYFQMINKNINTNNINKEELKYIIYLSEKHKFNHNCTNNQIMQPTKKYLINELKKNIIHHY